MIKQKLKYIFKGILTIACTLFLVSCGSKKDLVYFQDEPLSSQTENELDNNFELVYKQNDILTIDVSAQLAESVAAFNLPAVAYNTSGNAENQTTVLRQTYLIDNQGNIEFPVLGTLKIGGLTRPEATKMLKEKIGEYVKEFIVNIRLVNFTITVLGEVTKPGSFTVQSERISLTQALGLAGDLTIYGKRNNIFLIRDINGDKKYATFDLTSINVVNSPVYYLSQNDVIYVEPNTSKLKASTYNPNTGLLIAAISALAGITTAIYVIGN